LLPTFYFLAVDKLLEVLADFLKLLFTVSPATAVLFVACCALGYVVKHLFSKCSELQTAAVTQQKDFQLQLVEKLAERDNQHAKQMQAKDLELSQLHDRTVERDQATTKILEGLRVAIKTGNLGPITQSIWNGLEALGQKHGLTPREMNMLEHMKAGAAVLNSEG
jgi:hypothetical protein